MSATRGEGEDTRVAVGGRRGGGTQQHKRGVGRQEGNGENIRDGGGVGVGGQYHKIRGVTQQHKCVCVWGGGGHNNTRGGVGDTTTQEGWGWWVKRQEGTGENVRDGVGWGWGFSTTRLGG